jgi:hypothetical protein
MNILRLAFELFVLYLLYKLVFDFIIPVAKTTRQVKKQFKDINTRMQQAANEQQVASSAYQQPPKNQTVQGNKANGADYIDFEEVK